MPIPQEFLVPEYYPAFTCKGGQCRHSCCCGYEVNITMTEYFRLLGLDCPPPVRDALDRALLVRPGGREDAYATLFPNWEGDCRLHRADGYCALQGACGEKVLPAVCRYYPRSPRTDFVPECACANACEGVLEQLFASGAPLRQIAVPLRFALEGGRPAPDAAFAPAYRAVRTAVLDGIQNRALPLSARLLALDGLLAALEAPVARRDVPAVLAALGEAPRAAATGQPAGPAAPRALAAAAALLQNFGSRYATLAPYTEGLSARFGVAGPGSADAQNPALTELAAGSRAALAQYPALPLYMEQLFANHILYTGFPFLERGRPLRQSALVLAVACALLRVLTAANAADGRLHGQDALVDLFAFFFRAVEFTSFGRNVAVLLRGLDSGLWSAADFAPLADF